MERRMMFVTATVLAVLHPAWASPHTDSISSRDRAGECTIGVASGLVTTDGRPLFWKVRDIGPEPARQRLVHVGGSPLGYIGICTDEDGIYMGVNQVGVASGNSLVRPIPGLAPNSSVQSHILQNFDSVEQIDEYFCFGMKAGSCNASGCFCFIDALGNATMLEVNRSVQIWAYDSLDGDRQTQGLYGFVVRANEFHMQTEGTDDTSVSGRYASGVHNVLGLIATSGLNVQGLIQGASDAQDYYEFLRYGPGREMETIARPTTHSAVVVHGILPGEDPGLTTMWVILGQTNYSIAVPTWACVAKVPECLRSGLMYDRARSLWAKGEEHVTQASVFALEAHLLYAVTEVLLPQWRASGVPTVAEMTRIEARMADDAYSLLDCLDNRRSDNQTPAVSLDASADGLALTFSVAADDPDGLVVATIWDFGDAYYSTDPTGLHVYREPGTYLVSCTVTDDDGVSVTDWRYCEIHASDDLPQASEPLPQGKDEEPSPRPVEEETIGVNREGDEEHDSTVCAPKSLRPDRSLASDTILDNPQQGE